MIFLQACYAATEMPGIPSKTHRQGCCPALPDLRAWLQSLVVALVMLPAIGAEKRPPYLRRPEQVR